MSLQALLDGLGTSQWHSEKPLYPDSAQDAFEEARKLCGDIFASDEDLKQCLESNNSTKAILVVVQDAARRYNVKRESKARKWLTRLCARISLYGLALDMLAQHHPEYVALAWGTLKFVIQGVINHEELVKELAKALCRLGDALPQAEMRLVLYPTEGMRYLVEQLYVGILEFCQRALKWYSAGRLKHALSAIVRPYTLTFQDLVENIKEVTRKTKDLALSMSMVEIRQARIELEQARREQQTTSQLIMELKRALEESHHVQYSALLDTNKRTCEIQLSQIMSFAAMSPLPSPDVCRRYHCARRDQRRRNNGSDTPLRDEPQLQTWAADRTCSQLAICSSFEERHTARDFAVDAIDLISSAQVPVVWALSAQGLESGAFGPLDIAKYLVSQILQLNHNLLNERSASLSAARFRSARSCQDWFNVLGSVLQGLEQLYIIVDVDLLGQDMHEDIPWPDRFMQLADGLASKSIHTAVKVAFICSRRQHKSRLGSLDRHRVLEIPEGRKSRVKKAERVQHRASRNSAASQKRRSSFLRAVEDGVSAARV